MILQASSDVRAPLPFAIIIRDKFIAAIANDLDTKEWITTHKITRMLAGQLCKILFYATVKSGTGRMVK